MGMSHRDVRIRNYPKVVLKNCCAGKIVFLRNIKPDFVARSVAFVSRKELVEKDVKRSLIVTGRRIKKCCRILSRVLGKKNGNTDGVAACISTEIRMIEIKETDFGTDEIVSVVSLSKFNVDLTESTGSKRSEILVFNFGKNRLRKLASGNLGTSGPLRGGRTCK